VQNNPVKYTDPSGHVQSGSDIWKIDSQTMAIDVAHVIAAIIRDHGGSATLEVSAAGWITFTANYAAFDLGEGFYKFLVGLMEYIQAVSNSGALEAGDSVYVAIVYTVSDCVTVTCVDWYFEYGRCFKSQDGYCIIGEDTQKIDSERAYEPICKRVPTTGCIRSSRILPELQRIDEVVSNPKYDGR
jgi:hypothetical protein